MPLVVEVDKKWKSMSYRLAFKCSKHVTFRSASAASGGGGGLEMEAPVVQVIL